MKNAKKIFIIAIMLLTAVLLVACGGGGSGDKGGDSDGDTPSGECKHETYGTWNVTKIPTCSEAGIRQRKCDGCDKTEQESVAIVDHVFESYVSNNDATCKDGTKTAPCKFGCGNFDTKQDLGSGTGNHVGGTATCSAAPICSNCNSPYGYKASHVFENYVSNGNATCTSDGTKTAYCKYGCMTPDTVADVGSGGHFGGTATCILKPKCQRCGERYGKVLEHKFVNYQYNNDATCGDGTETAVCSNSGCNQTHTRTKLGSGTGNHTGGTATCEYLKVCDVCSEPYGQVLGHKYLNYVSNNDATCKDGTKTAKCENDGCQSTKTVTDIGSANNNHPYEVLSVTPVSCTAPSVRNLKCTECGTEKTETLAPATGHSLVSFTQSSKTPIGGKACTYTVVLVGECRYCGKTDATVEKEEVIHNEKVTITTEATCVSEGVKTYKCQNCDAVSYTKPYSDPNAHKWGENGSAVNGIQPYKCSNLGCGATKSVIATTDKSYTASPSVLLQSELMLGSVSMKLDQSTVEQLGATNVTLTASELSGSERDNAVNKLTAEQKEALNGRPIYDFTMKQGTSVVSEFDGKIKITVPYTLAPGEDPECVAVWFISDNGKVEQIPAVYSCGSVTFETDHFSKYSVTEVTPENACALSGHDYRQGASVVAATCETVGYTVYVCNRCGTSETATTAPAIGHRYDMPTQTVPATCYTEGKYVYTCTAQGCGKTVEIVVPITHSLEYLASVSANCKNDGYLKEKCSQCGYVKITEYKSDPQLHNYVRDAALSEDADDCTEGVDIFVSCSVEGCDYYKHNYYVYSHDPLYYYKENASMDVVTETFELAEFFPADFKNHFGNASLKLVATKAACACGKGYSRIEFVEEQYAYMPLFTNLTCFSIDASSFSGDINTEPQYFESERMMYTDPTVTIMVVNAEQTEGCIKLVGVEVHVGYNSSTATAEKVMFFAMGGQTAHDVEQTVTLKYEGGLCKDGVVITRKCRQCGQVLSVDDTARVTDHYYVNNSLPFNFDDELSALGHEARFDVYRCPCGSEKVVLNADNCIFNKVSGTENEYACSCGHRYKEVKTVERLSDCVTRTKQVVYYDYDPDTQTYLKSTAAIPSYNYEYNHVVKGVREDVSVRGCKVDYVVRYICDCGKYEKYSYAYDGTTYDHDSHTVRTVSPDGTVREKTVCKNCLYVYESVTDKDGNITYNYYVTDDPDSNEKTARTWVYSMIGGEMMTVLEKVDMLDDSGNIIYWQHTAYFYNQTGNPDNPSFSYVVDSLGKSDYNEFY